MNLNKQYAEHKKLEAHRKYMRMRVQAIIDDAKKHGETPVIPENMKKYAPKGAI